MGSGKKICAYARHPSIQGVTNAFGSDKKICAYARRPSFRDDLNGEGIQLPGHVQQFAF